jgi:hypothetical protein
MAVVDGHIRCSHCKEWLAVSCFGPSTVVRGNGVCSKCTTKRSSARRANPDLRARENARTREWYRKNKATHLARTQSYYRRNRGRAEDRHYERTYGISLSEYNRMLDAQGGGCAICGKRQGAEKYKLAVDHDHSTGRVRGILCHRCNRAIGAFGDTVEGVRRALKYLEAGESCEVIRSAPTMRINLLGAN